MRYRELLEHVQTNIDPEIDARLRQDGYEPIGIGRFATVYRQRGGKNVLKILHKRDEAFMAYVDFVRTHRSPHFPIFHGQPKVVGDYYEIEMEYLTPYGGDWRPIWSYFQSKMPDGQRHAQAADDFMRRNPTLKEACDLMIRDLLPHWGLDLKSDNILMRGKTLVFVDPVANKNVVGRLV